MEAQEPPTDLAPEIAAVLALRRVALVGLPEPAAGLAATALAAANVLSQRLPPERLHPLPEPFDCVVCAVAALAGDPPAGLRTLSVPVLALGPCDQILAGVAGAYGWADGFLACGWTGPQLLLAVYQVLARRRSGRSGRSRCQPLVLLVEDDFALASLVEGVLINQGLLCRHAADGLAGITAIRELLPDVVVLDVNIPVMSGFEVLAAVRSDPGLARLPVAILTACNDSGNVLQGSRLGADDYITKPITPVSLSGRIKRLLQRGYAAAPAAAAEPEDSREPPAAPAEPAAQALKIRELRDEYLKQRQDEVATIRGAVIAGDFDSARRIGHQLRGSGGAYGFPELTRIGAAIESAAAVKATATLLEILQDLRRCVWLAARGIKE